MKYFDNIKDKFNKKIVIEYTIISVFFFFLVLLLTYFFNSQIWLVIYHIEHVLTKNNDVSPDNFFNDEITFIQNENNKNQFDMTLDDKKAENLINIKKKFFNNIELSVKEYYQEEEITNTNEGVKENLEFKKVEKISKWSIIPFNSFVKDISKLIVNWKTEPIVYKDITENIQMDLYDKSVISIYKKNPIIFSHSSWWKQNFWLSFLWLRNGDYVYLLGKKWSQNFYIKIKIKEIHKDIPWKELDTFLADVKYNTNDIILDTCEIRFTNRRVIIWEMEDIIFK